MRLLAAAVVVALTPGTPGTFIAQILKEELNGNWSVQWRALHPAHQKLITQKQYVACSRTMGTNFATGHEVFRVLDVRNDRIAVRGVPQKTSKLVKINVHQRGNANGITYYMHAVRVDGRWRWILGDAFLSALARGKCLDGSPLRR